MVRSNRNLTTLQRLVQAGTSRAATKSPTIFAYHCTSALFLVLQIAPLLNFFGSSRNCDDDDDDDDVLKIVVDEDLNIGGLIILQGVPVIIASVIISTSKQPHEPTRHHRLKV